MKTDDYINSTEESPQTLHIHAAAASGQSNKGRVWWRQPDVHVQKKLAKSYILN